MPLVEVRRAIYAYTPADGDELEMREDDVLYIVNNDDADWLQAKRKVFDINEPEKQGLVPANHTEIIAPIARAKALYAYEPALEEETTLVEDEEIDIIEQDDPDWYMAHTRGGYGFVPKAYVEIVSGENQGIVNGANANSIAPPIPQQLPPSPKVDASAPILDTPVPTIRPSQEVPAALSPPPPPPLPPILPSQPSAPLPSEPAAKPLAPKTAEVDSISHFNVVLGKKKKGQKITLGVSNPTLIVDSNDDTVLPKRYSTGDISRCSTKKALLTVEIGGFEPAAFDFTCASNSEADRIADAINAARRGMFIGDRMIEPQTNLQQQLPKEDVSFMLPSQSNEPSLPPNIDAPFVSPPSSIMPSNSQEYAKVLYDFSSDDPEELSVKEGDTVLVLDKSDSDWWQIRESLANGRVGLVPAAYVEVQPAETLPPVPKRTETVRKAAAQVHQSSLQQQEPPPLHIEPPPRMETPRHTENSVAAILRGDKTPDSDNVPLQFLQKRPEEPVPPPMPKRPSEAAKLASLGPDPNKVRTWTDGSGAYTVEAQFIKLDSEGNVHLHKTNSKMITVPLAKFSEADRRYVSSVSGQQLPEVKTARQRQQEDAKKTPGRRIINYDWDWFDFFTLKCGITADNALKYATSFVAERLDDASIPEITSEYMKTLGVKPADVPRLERALREHQGLPVSEAPASVNKDQAMQSPRGLAMEPERAPALPPAYTAIANESPVKKPVQSPPVKEPARSPRQISNNPWGVDSELDRRFDRRRQIEDDEALARQLQQQEEDERRHGYRRKNEPKHKQPLNLGIGSRKLNKSQTSVVDPAQLRTAQQRLGSPPARAASPPLGSPLKSPQSNALKSSSQTAIDLAFAPQMEQIPPPRARPAPRQTSQQHLALAQSPPTINQQNQQLLQSTDLTTHNMAAATASGNTAQMIQLEQMAKARAQELALQESRIKQQQEEMRKQAQFLQQQQQQLLQMQQTQKVEAQLKQLKEEKERMEKQRQAEELQKQAATIKAQQEQLLKMQQMAAQARAQQSAPMTLSSVSMPQTQAITNM
ncbi:cytoskeletal protein binding protein, partial [Coemansia brasiliensis]